MACKRYDIEKVFIYNYYTYCRQPFPDKDNNNRVQEQNKPVKKNIYTWSI